MFLIVNFFIKKGIFIMNKKFLTITFILAVLAFLTQPLEWIAVFLFIYFFLPKIIYSVKDFLKDLKDE